ncbi:MAG: hypothetical protein Q8O68_00865 [Candidatus Daviesbacteria bacterium]|nr:hypothetical protein [Candidatus Daviesbacteria bacterium]
MPPKAEILSRTTQLKEHLYGMINHLPAETVEEWSGEEKGATFHLTKPEGVYAVAEGTPSALMLGLRGEAKGRRRIEKDFTKAFGKPKTIFPATGRSHCRVLFWNTEKALETAKAEVMAGSNAYSLAMKNLESTWSYPDILRETYPDRYFHYGDGWGLVLPHKLVHISTSSAEDIREISGRLTIKNQPDLTGQYSKFRDIGSKIPDKAIGDIIAFTEEVKTKIFAQVHRK